jgi:type IV pilus assembly protein PilM
MGARAKATGRPRLACEISAARVVAARLAEAGDAVEMHTTRSLPTGAVKPSLTESNVLDPAALRSAIGEALDALSGRSRDVIAVLPDASVRIVMLDFDSLPQKADEALGVVRFRLRKTLPFDVDRAVVSYNAQPSADSIKVVAAVALASVLEEYERAFVDSGFLPGVLLPSTLASLGNVEGGEATLVVKVSEDSTTVAIVDGDQLRLFRSLERRQANGDAAAIVEDVYPSLVFFQDTYSSSIERVLVAGQTSAESLASHLAPYTSARVQELVREHQISGGFSAVSAASSGLAGVVGALLG